MKYLKSFYDCAAISAVQECKDVLAELQKIEKRSKFKDRTEESSATQYFQVLYLFLLLGKFLSLHRNFSTQNLQFKALLYCNWLPFYILIHLLTYLIISTEHWLMTSIFNVMLSTDMIRRILNCLTDNPLSVLRVFVTTAEHVARLC